MDSFEKIWDFPGGGGYSTVFFYYTQGRVLACNLLVARVHAFLGIMIFARVKPDM